MKKIYTDTSVIGGCFDTELKENSLKLLTVFKTGFAKAIISDLTIVELAPARREIKNKIHEVPTAHIIQAGNTESVYNLVEAYIKAAILLQKSYHDLLHIALATVYKADILASWNFKDILEKIPLYNEINMRMGYKTIDIVTPTLILKTIIYGKRETI